jgi:hypothetical protein
MYPADHRIAEQRIYQFVQVIAQSPEADDDTVVESLVKIGLPRIDAELLLAFIPSAFAWIVMQKMGLESFPSTFYLCDEKDVETEYLLSSQHYFSSALLIAEDIFSNGYTPQISKALYQSIALRSAEMNATNSLLKAGKSLKGAKLQPLRLYRIDAQQFSALVNMR